MTDLLTNATEKITHRVAEHRETAIRQAIDGTDWSETAVLRIIEYHPDPLSDVGSDPGDYSITLPEFDIQRYSDRAPPISEHANREHQCTIRTITKPLLNQLAKEHPEIAAVE